MLKVSSGKLSGRLRSKLIHSSITTTTETPTPTLLKKISQLFQNSPSVEYAKAVLNKFKNTQKFGLVDVDVCRRRLYITHVQAFQVCFILFFVDVPKPELRFQLQSITKQWFVRRETLRFRFPIWTSYQGIIYPKLRALTYWDRYKVMLLIK